MKRYLLAALLPCVLALPAHGQTTPKERPAKAQPISDEAEMKVLQTEMAGYGAWLQRLDAANAEATAELQNIQGEWRAAARMPAAEAIAQFRPVVAQAKAKIAEARLRVRALDTPAFPALELDADATPPALIAQVLRLYDRIDMLLDSFGPMLIAMAKNDVKAAMSAVEQMIDAAQLLLDTQAVLTNASLATTDREMGAYQVILIQVRIYQAASRAMGAAKLMMRGRQDPALAADLIHFADEIDAASVEGRRVMTAKLAQWDAVTKTGDSDAVKVLRRTSAVLRVDLQLFDATPAFSAVLRATAAKASGSNLVPSDITAISNAFTQIRNLINTISTQENAAMAGS